MDSVRPDSLIQPPIGKVTIIYEDARGRKTHVFNKATNFDIEVFWSTPQTFDEPHRMIYAPEMESVEVNFKPLRDETGAYATTKVESAEEIDHAYPVLPSRRCSRVQCEYPIVFVEDHWFHIAPTGTKHDHEAKPPLHFNGERYSIPED